MLALHGQTVSTFASQATPFLSLGQGTWFPFCIGRLFNPGLLGVYGLEVTGLFLKRHVTKPFKGNVCRWELPCPPSVLFDTAGSITGGLQCRFPHQPPPRSANLGSVPHYSSLSSINLKILLSHTVWPLSMLGAVP